MTSRLKSIFKRQSSQPNRSTENTKNHSQDICEEINDMPKVTFLNGDLSFPEDSKTADRSVILRKKHGRRRHRTSLGAIDEILQCAICNERFKVPKMLPCQHTFCLKCLESQALNNKETPFRCSTCFLKIEDCSPDKLPTNMYIENMLKIVGNTAEKSEKNMPRSLVVSFATEAIKCSKCSAVCRSENRCEHCRQVLMFCISCSPEHVEALKEELDVIAEHLENTACKIDSRIKEFRNKIDTLKENIDKEIERRISQLKKECDERLQKVSEILIKGEKSAAEIKQRIFITQVEVIEQKSGIYDSITDDQEKIKIFLHLHTKMMELMEVVSDWEPEFSITECSMSKAKDHRSEIAKIKPNLNLQYKIKSFIPKVVSEHKTMQRPSGLAFDLSRDYVYVACSGIKPKILVLDKKLKMLRRFQHADMIAPQRVAFLEDTDEVYVTDKWKHCVFVFDRKGEFLRQMCNKSQEEGKLRSPEGISTHPRQRLLYIADSGNDRIVILDSDGSYQGSIGTTETSATTVNKAGKAVSISVNHLNQPTDVVVSLTEVVVADSGNHKIKIFNHKGILLHSIGGLGVMRGFFRSPEVVKLDNKGNIIVGDSGNGRVQIFSRQGELLKSFGEKGSKAGQFSWISGLVIKPNLEIIVADSKNNTLQLF
ncbi:RING finger protein nhl-1-like isoform X2 [Belonocnema kinseyi]|uniref:RING finger protein nhl-1-like isoform X2 n=1 Tax=Belonocnema kinseyi TaxID=2817044 RepID=UPI00143CFF31|nr:RING finger protein nhl-1-like isoform X2 [Belonocnema kinseyi]